MLEKQNDNSESDYVLPDGKSCWITVGNRSIYITNNAGVSGQWVSVFELGKEDGDPISTVRIL